MASASGCSLDRSTLAAKLQNFVVVEARRRHDRDHLGLALGQRARLVDHQRVDLLHVLQRFGILDQHTGRGTASDPDHDRHRRGQTKRAGAGDDQHADGGDQAERHPRFRPKPGPGAERDHGNGDDDRHEPAGDLIGQPLDRRARALRLGDHLDDLRQQRVAPDLVGAHHEAAGLVERARDHGGPDFLGNRHRFAGYQRFVERGAALQNHAVDRHLLTRTNPQVIAGLQAVDLHFMIGAVCADAARGLRRQLQQRLDGAGCRLAGAQLEHLAQQHEHGNDRGGFEVNRDRAAMSAEGGREDVGRDGADDAVDIGDTGAHRDQREHVEIARQQRLPAAHEEWPARPEHHGRGEDQLNPVRQGLVDPAVTADQVTAHFQHHRRQRQRAADPEPPCHVGELGIGRRIEARDLGLQRHAADRATTGADLADLRMHRAGVDGAFGRFGLRLAVAEIGFVDRRRIWSGSRPSRNGRCRRDGRSDACLSRGPPSCRRRDRARWRWRARGGRGRCDRDVRRSSLRSRSWPRSSYSPPLATYTR